MADDARLIVSLEARVNQFERNLARANATAGRQFGSIERRAEQAGGRLDRTAQNMAQRVNAQLGRIGTGLGTIGASFAGGLIGGGITQTISSIIPAVRGATRALSDLNAEAKMAGVDVETFQALGYAARQSNVGVDALTDGLKELQLRADEFVVTGKGPAAEAFARLGYAADELKAKLRNPSDLFLEIIGRLQALDKAAQIRVSDEIFGGTGGEQFVRFLEDGEAGIRRNMEAAKSLGNVIDKDVVRKGAELDKEFQKIAETIDNNVKTSVVNVATSLRDWFTNTERFLNTLGNSEVFKKIAEWTSADWSTVGNPEVFDRSRPAATVRPGVDELRRALLAMEGVARPNVPDRAQQLPGTFVDPKLSGLTSDFRDNLAKLIIAAREAGHNISVASGFRTNERQRQLFAEAVQKYGSEAEARKHVAPEGKSFHNKGSAADLSFDGGVFNQTTASQVAARNWAHSNASRFGLTFPIGEAWHIEPEGQRGQSTMGDPDTSSLEEAAANKSAAARQKAADQAKRQEDAVRKVVEALGLEASQIGQTAEKQELLQRLQQAGVELNSAEGQAIAAKVAQLYALKAAQDLIGVNQQKALDQEEELKRRREALADVGADFTKGFVADLKAGASATDALRNALDRLLTKLADNAIDSIFRMLLGGGGKAGGGLFDGLLGSGLGGLLFGGGRAEGGPVGHIGFDKAERFL